ncbi:FAD-dependent oxidoreductase [Verrucomicrobium spinosum]|uniref:FAD-dependent oxidoreductase n=1 Tax=Verrucomicrobium spinosum TaxID=2736 RepID=UPI0009ECAD29|nr:FAD-dependent oxidoreductase [Verrucomicrobium spinosum]
MAVIGGGIAGLTCALRLAEAGRQVTLIEATEQLGGLGGTCDYDGRTFEKFYHCMLPTDWPLLDLLTDLGLHDEVYWKPTTFGYASGTKIFPLNKALDLLKFSPLGISDRIRVGLTGLQGRRVSSEGLDDITAAEWLTKLSGRKAFEVFWKPMLQAKFGDRYDAVPALWFWSRFNREKADKMGEVKGYIRGGYRRIAEIIGKRITSLGGVVRLRERMVMLDLDRSDRPLVVTSRGEAVYDQVVITTRGRGLTARWARTSAGRCRRWT